MSEGDVFLPAEPASSINDFSQGRVPALIGRLAAPMILAELVNALYNIVDRFYIARIPGIGDVALAGLGVAYPIILIVTAFATLFGMGGAPLCSIARGQRDHRQAERIMGSSFAMLMAAGLALTAVTIMAKRTLLTWFGASQATLPLADSYLAIYLLGTPFAMVTMGMNPYINAQGYAKVGMLSVAVGALANVLLDPIFIFALDMGVEGAALATILSQAASAFWVLRFLTGSRALLRLRREHIRFDWPLIRRITALGASTFTMRVTECAVQIGCNVTLMAYGGDVYVSVFTVISSIRQVLMMPLNGFVQGYQPVASYNYGAKRCDRVRACVKFAALACLGYATLCCALVLLLPGALLRLFNATPAMMGVGAPALRIYFGGFCFLFMQMVGQFTYVALGKSRQAVFFSLLRKAFIVLPLTFLLPLSIGVNGVFWAEFASDLIGSTACFLTFMLTVYRRELR